MNEQSGSPLAPIVERIRSQLESAEKPAPILLIGGIEAGKTATGLRLLSLLRSYGIQVGGILAPRLIKDEETIGYSLIDLATNATHPFVGLEPSEIPIGKFFMSQQGLDIARRAIESALEDKPVIFVDEMGRLELGGGGHAPAVRVLLSSDSIPVLLVRDNLVEAVLKEFGIGEHFAFHVAGMTGTDVVTEPGEQTFWHIVDSNPYPLLVTHSKAGFAESRPMHLIDRDRNTLWFATSRASRKVKQIDANPKVTVLFIDSARYNYAAFHGLAHIVQDPEREQTLWRNEWTDDWPEGPADPDYVLLRVDASRAHYLRGYTGESGTLQLR